MTPDPITPWATLASAVIAVAALAVSYGAIRTTRRVESSGFRASEHVKVDTASLVAALRGFQLKAVVYSQQARAKRDDPNSPDFVDIAPEREAIQRFLGSSTAFAYYAFAARKGIEAQGASREQEEWRTFSIRLAMLLQGGSPYGVGVEAAKLEAMLAAVTEEDLKQMAEELGDLPRALQKASVYRAHDPIFRAIAGIAEEERNNEKAVEEDFSFFVRLLRDQGINDPEVDLIWAEMNGDAALISEATARGANVSVTGTEIVARYRQWWDVLQSMKSKVQRAS